MTSRVGQSAESGVRLSHLRLVLVTGKGGVGKTSVTAALALALAKMGKRVLCSEIATDTEASSPLARMFGRTAAAEEPEEVLPGIHLGAIHCSRGHQRFLRETLKVNWLADAAIKSTPIRRFLGTAPAFPEMGTMYRILELMAERDRSGKDRFDVVLVDLPATGHALALAQIPGVLLRVLPGGPIVEAVRKGLAILSDPTQTGVVIVTLPETLPVSEALELADGVRSHEIPLAGILLNRVPENPFSPEERAALREYGTRASSVLGLRTAARIDRAEAARERLAEKSHCPVGIFPDSLVTPDAIPEALAPFFGEHR